MPNTEDMKENQILRFENNLEKKMPAIIVKKGKVDTIISNDAIDLVSTKGGLKRCGGIGDVLAGSIATCAFWNLELGVVLGCHVTRLATRLSFEREGRCLTAP